MTVEIATDGTNPGRAAYAAEENDIFQVPAQFNTLQNGYGMKADGGIVQYVTTSTYARQCALVATPGLLVRNWIYNIPDDFNTLRNIKGINYRGEIYNGHLIWRARPEKIYEALATQYNNIQIASQIYIQVCGPVVDGSECIFPKYSTKLIHQVFASTASINTHGNGGDKAYQDAIAASLQQAAYYGTLGMAIILANADNDLHHYDNQIKPGRKTVNLILMGTDANNNVDTCLAMMVDMLKIFKDYPLHIVVHAYPLKAVDCRQRLVSIWPEIPIIPLKK